ncbi:MAG: hypothetical protein AAF196_13045 [Planctomycetota bacterium]
MNRPVAPQILTSMLALCVLGTAFGCGSAPTPFGGLEAEESESQAEQAESELQQLDPISLELDPNPASIDEEASLNRLFSLDALGAELARAIQEGFDEGGELAAKLRDVERELAWRRESLGRDAIDQARLLRLERLKRLPIVLR